MKTILLSVLIALLGCLSLHAQENGYKVSGVIEGMANGTLLLVGYDSGKADTLGITLIQQGKFEFTGKTETPMLVYLSALNQQGAIPLMLENTEIVVNVNSTGMVVIKGGPLQEIFGQFTGINEEVGRKQQEMQQEINIAQQEGNVMKMQVIQQQFNKIVEETRVREAKMLEEYSDTYVAAYVIASSMMHMSLEQLKENYRILGENARKTVPGRTIATFIAAQEKVMVGSVAPDFTVTTVDGSALTLSGIKGKVKILDFWASWCKPCREENVNLLKLYKKYQTDGLEIISISIDDNKKAWEKAIDEDGMIWLNGSDLKGQNSDVARKYFLKAIPHTILLDENNKIIAKDLRGDELRKKVAELLKDKK